jgi:AcrR family transcriptional regulator
MNRRLTPRGQDRRTQLMDFAARRFAENGYHPTSVAEIVQGMGVGKGVFYWYFNSKEELLAEILRQAQRDMRRRQQQWMGEETDPVRRIELGIRGTMQWVEDNRHLSTLFQFASTEERFAPAIRRGQEIAVEDVARHVKEGVGEGRIRDMDPEVLAHAVIGATNHLARTYLIERRDPPEQVADAAVAFCIGGLLGPTSA